MGELKTSVEVHELCASDQNSVRMRRLPREEKATSEVDVDKAPRLSISNDNWILSSDTVTICQLNQLFSNSEAASQRRKGYKQGERRTVRRPFSGAQLGLLL